MQSLLQHSLRSALPAAVGVAALGGLVLGLAPAALAQGELSPAEIQNVETIELQIALKASQKQQTKAAARIAELETKLSTIGESLAAANTDAELVRAENTRLRQEMEAVGISSLDPSADGLRTRLKESLAALSEERARNRQLSAELLDLSDAVRTYMATAVAGSADAQIALGEHLRSASVLLGLELLPDLGQETLQNIRIVAIRDDLDLVVLDAGTEAGTRIGMPLRLMRKDRVVGEAVVVDVRGHVSGAIVQKFIQQGDAPRVGDLALIDPNTLR